MTKIKLEYLRLIITFLFFICLVSFLFMHVNQVNPILIEKVAKGFIITAIVLNIVIPVWLVIDLIRKKVADKSLFNLTFFISIIAIGLLFFTMTFL